MSTGTEIEKQKTSSHRCSLSYSNIKCNRLYAINGNSGEYPIIGIKVRLLEMVMMNYTYLGPGGFEA